MQDASQNTINISIHNQLWIRHSLDIHSDGRQPVAPLIKTPYIRHHVEFFTKAPEVLGIFMNESAPRRQFLASYRVTRRPLTIANCLNAREKMNDDGLNTFETITLEA